MHKQILVMFGGVSPEHEVSVITGLQVVENLDKNEYDCYPIFVNKKGEITYLKDLNSRKDFKKAKQIPVTFGHDQNGGFLAFKVGFSLKRIYPYSAYLAFHGGNGENGAIQGMLESFEIPYTSCSKESSAILMNKQLTKEQVALAGIKTVEGLSIKASQLKHDVEQIGKDIISTLGLPLIIKPAHLGSSIGIKIAKTDVELEKSLLDASFIDTEILVEKFLENITEYNCSVRLINGKLELSEIEKPFTKDQILSFADKYQRGGKKTSGTSGMASLQRELPAKISAELKNQIQESAQKAFLACRCKGMVRIDFMYSNNQLYLTEINSIPGSMAFYLWEASGISFKTQIGDLVEQSVKDFRDLMSTTLDYKTDIIEKFIAQD